MLYKKSHGIEWVFKKLISLSVIYKCIVTINSLFRYIADLSYISDTLYSNEFKEVLHKYLHLNVKKDWIGRLYGIINPNIDINGNLDFNNTIIEIDGENTNSSEYVKTWCYRQMQLIDELFKINKLYDYINMEFQHVGPVNGDNYLVVFDIVSRKEFTHNLKKFLLQSILYILIAIITFAFV